MAAFWILERGTMNELQAEGRVANLRATPALHGADRGRNDPDTSARKAHLFRGGCGCKVLQGVSQFPPRDRFHAIRTHRISADIDPIKPRVAKLTCHCGKLHAIRRQRDVFDGCDVT